MAGRSRVPLLVAVVVGVIAVVAVKAATGGSGSGGGSASTPSNAATDKGCTTIGLTASSEKAALLQQIAGDYAKANHQVAGACARVVVTSKASGGAADALARGWDQALDGPRPDVWSPASTSWTVLLKQKTTARDRPDLVGDAKLGTVARTPLVLAMPKPMALALGWPAKPLGWGDVLKLANDPRGWASVGRSYGAFKLGKTNPNFSTSGLNATVGTYFAATGLSSDLSLKNLSEPAVDTYVRGVENSVVHYGDTTLTYLSNLQKADDKGQALSYVSAVAVEEKSVWDYNQGNPTGDPRTLGQHAKPSTQLVAIYPKEGTLFSDNPYAVLKAPWVDDKMRGVAADFLAYLQADSAQQLFARAAFRSFDGKPGDQITPAQGLLPDQPKAVLSPPAPAVLAAVQASWEKVRKRARVLLVIDTSGSMAEKVGSQGQTKLELAKTAARKAVALLAPDDQVALWSFSTERTGESTPYRKLVEFGPAGKVLGTVKAKIDELQPDGGTALYATARAASKQLRAQYDLTRINAVVLLTDGKNEYPADSSLDSLTRELTSEDADRQVRVFTIAYGDNADLAELTRIADASLATAYDASDPASIDKVLTAVLSNF